MLGRTYNDVAELEKAKGRSEAALKWYDKAIATVELVLGKEPRLALGRRVLRSAFSNRAEALGMLKRYSDAAEDWDRVIATDDEKLAGFRRKRAYALARSGEHARATAEADVLSEADDATKDAIYDTACIYALSSAAASSDAQQSECYAARAVELLRRAIQKGFRDVQHMKQDSDLDSLRKREDFQKLLGELEKKDSKDS
jgi:tetratricopeptide (TPR) repeat protein